MSAPTDPPWTHRLAPVLSGRPSPRVIATDLDGTLMRPDKTVSGRTRHALTAAVEAGLRVVMVTARPPRWVDHLAPMVGSDGIVLCANGAFVYDVRSRTVVEEHTLPAELVLDLIADLRRSLPGIVFGFERVNGMALEAGYTSDYPLPPDAPRGSAEKLLDLLPGKLLARCPGMSAGEFQQLVVDVIGDRAIVADSGAVGLAEIAAPGVTKAAALQRWTARHAIDAARVWAFGDMPNDLTMLAWAGVGVAVANAHPAVLSTADLVCPSNEEDGVAQVIEVVVGSAPAGPNGGPALPDPGPGGLQFR